MSTPAISVKSNALFSVADPIKAYYVDDNSNTGDEYTPGAVGSDANNGLSALTPKATIRSVLDTYDLEPGDTIYVDTGVYNLTLNIIMAVQDSGVTIQGPTGTGHVVELKRGSS